MKKILLIAFTFIHAFNGFSQRPCEWFVDLQDSLIEIQKEAVANTLSLDSSYKIWQNIMLQNNYSYSYVVRGADLLDSNSESYTFIKVIDNVIVERKHYSYSMYGVGYDIKCFPSKENCDYLKGIEKLRKSDRAKAKKLLKNHLEEH
ncbi:hypothetical protein LVD15_14120 [Fulvivirga maritima]|uniref:hypothetical protein n=1 Tax=Fulvivirga maritima TaxID=2904247 RepID=UPI001F357D0C|nr:hypothetical protein [Fulvivirga maritima]UII24459.1 hypothetical protein LVD15_14120 [Fulvivirga maritima]